MLFIDIETVPVSLDPKTLELFEKKFQHKAEEQGIDITEYWDQNAGLYAEFGKIVCVCVGNILGDNLRINTLYSKNEYDILDELQGILNKSSALCAHNGKEFDYPFLTRRFIIHRIKVPNVLNAINKKPWELALHDTMEMWSGTQWKYRCSLDLICNVLGLPSPKNGLDGSKVGELYYSDDPEALQKIGSYCAGDVIALANVYCRLVGSPLPEGISYV